MIKDNIITERLVIRDMTKDDAKEVYEIWGQDENEEYISDPVESLEEVEAIFDETSPRTTYLRVAILKETGEIIGTCCFGPADREDEWGFGYSIKKYSWGKGFATEVVKGIISFSHSLGINDFVSDCAKENTASANVLKKAGMYFDHISSYKQNYTDKIFESEVYKLHID